MGPITSLDPPAGALSNPSNGKENVSVLDSCQGSVKTQFDHPIHHQDTKSTKYFLVYHDANAHSNPNPFPILAIAF